MVDVIRENQANSQKWGNYVRPLCLLTEDYNRFTNQSDHDKNKARFDDKQRQKLGVVAIF